MTGVAQWPMYFYLGRSGEEEVIAAQEEVESLGTLGHMGHETAGRLGSARGLRGICGHRNVGPDWYLVLTRPGGLRRNSVVLW